jgi:hypothetical protein
LTVTVRPVALEACGTSSGKEESANDFRAVASYRGKQSEELCPLAAGHEDVLCGVLAKVDDDKVVRKRADGDRVDLAQRNAEVQLSLGPERLNNARKRPARSTSASQGRQSQEQRAA